jgi:putative DNA primase/helicase
MILVGTGANGKSVLHNVVCALFGAENVSSYSLQSLTDKQGYYRAMIVDKLLNFASEISTSMNVTIFKQLVSGEPTEARHIHKSPFILTSIPRFMFNTNMLPRDVEQNEAFYRRFIIVEFKVTIPERERDPDLSKKIISEELPGIFNWVLEGLDRLLKNKSFTSSEQIVETLKEYRQTSDTVSMFLEDENYKIDPNGKLIIKGVYEIYSNYCKLYGYKACSLKTFTERLRSLGIEVARTAEGNIAGLAH